jgi:hypothetical protein
MRSELQHQKLQPRALKLLIPLQRSLALATLAGLAARRGFCLAKSSSAVLETRILVTARLHPLIGVEPRQRLVERESRQRAEMN